MSPTRNFQATQPNPIARDTLRIVGEVTAWTGHSPEQLKHMRDRLAELERLGIEAIED